MLTPRKTLLCALILASGCGARGRPSPIAPAPSAPAVTPVAAPTTSREEAPRPSPAPSPAPSPTYVLAEPVELHTDAFMVRPHPVIETLDRKAYCVDGTCRGLDAQLAEIRRAAKGRAAPACSDLRGRACGERCGSVMLGTWSGGKTITFHEAFGGPIIHCYDRGGQLVAAHHSRPSGPQFGNIQDCFESAPTRPLCRPVVLEASCPDGRCLAFSTMVAAVKEIAARSANHGCDGLVTPVCGGENPACQSVTAATCPGEQTVMVKHAGGYYLYKYSAAGALLSTDHSPLLDHSQAGRLTFGQPAGGASCTTPARSLCRPS